MTFYRIRSLSGFLNIALSDTISPAWITNYASGLVSSLDEATAMVVDDEGNVYVTGSSDQTYTSYDYLTIKYNSIGVQQWVARYNGPDNNEDRANAISVDASGNVYVTGYSYGSGTSEDYATIKYNSSGVQQWVARYNGPGNSLDEAAAISVDASGNVYVTGSSLGSGTNGNYATIKYNSSGVQQWVARYNGPSNSLDEAAAISVDASGNVYVTGNSGGGNWSVITTLKYIDPPLISIPKTSITFDELNVLCSSTKYLTARNTGGSVLIIKSAFSNHSNFTISPANSNINPGDSVLFTVKFSPKSVGYKSGEIIFIHNALSSPDSIHISGTGIEPTAW